jgi:signal transduction histidine kinase
MAGSRQLNLGDARLPVGSPHRIQPSRDRSTRVGTAALDIANDLLARSVVSFEIAEQALERLRHDALAVDASFWMITADSATCALRVGDDALGQPLPTISLSDRRTLGALRGRRGALSYSRDLRTVAGLVSTAAQSCLLLSSVNDAGGQGVLVFGWQRPAVPVDDTAISHLQIVAGALLRTLFGERVLGSRVTAARDQERTRIARELHDDLGQQTALLATRIDVLLMSSKASAANLRDGIEEAKQNVQDLAVAIHALSHELHPPKLRLLGLEKTVESLCKNLSKASGVNISFQQSPLPANIAEHVSLCVCRVAQEALQNAVKHSGAREIDVALTATTSDVRLRVSDAGRGFDPSAPHPGGIGLSTMRERVESCGGRLSVVAATGGGVTINAVVPIAAA